jgi:hypothetical protein
VSEVCLTEEVSEPVGQGRSCRFRGTHDPKFYPLD